MIFSAEMWLASPRGLLSSQLITAKETRTQPAAYASWKVQAKTQKLSKGVTLQNTACIFDGNREI